MERYQIVLPNDYGSEDDDAALKAAFPDLEGDDLVKAAFEEIDRLWPGLKFVEEIDFGGIFESDVAMPDNLPCWCWASIWDEAHENWRAGNRPQGQEDNMKPEIEAAKKTYEELDAEYRKRGRYTSKEAAVAVLLSVAEVLYDNKVILRDANGLLVGPLEFNDAVYQSIKTENED